MNPQRRLVADLMRPRHVLLLMISQQRRGESLRAPRIPVAQLRRDAVDQILHRLAVHRDQLVAHLDRRVLLWKNRGIDLIHQHFSLVQIHAESERGEVVRRQQERRVRILEGRHVLRADLPELEIVLGFAHAVQPGRRVERVETHPVAFPFDKGVVFRDHRGDLLEVGHALVGRHLSLCERGEK